VTTWLSPKYPESEPGSIKADHLCALPLPRALSSSRLSIGLTIHQTAQETAGPMANILCLEARLTSGPQRSPWALPSTVRFCCPSTHALSLQSLCFRLLLCPGRIPRECSAALPRLPSVFPHCCFEISLERTSRCIQGAKVDHLYCDALNFLLCLLCASSTGHLARNCGRYSGGDAWTEMGKSDNGLRSIKLPSTYTKDATGTRLYLQEGLKLDQQRRS